MISDIQGRKGLKTAPALHRKVWRLKMCRSPRVQPTWTRQRTAAPVELCFFSWAFARAIHYHGCVQDVAVALDGRSTIGIGESGAKGSRKSCALSEQVKTSCHQPPFSICCACLGTSSFMKKLEFSLFSCAHPFQVLHLCLQSRPLWKDCSASRGQKASLQGQLTAPGLLAKDRLRVKGIPGVFWYHAASACLRRTRD